MATRAVLCLRIAHRLVLAYLCAGELLPPPVIEATTVLRMHWEIQRVAAIASLSLITSISAAIRRGSGGVEFGPQISLLLAALNTLPIVAWLAATPWMITSDDCDETPTGDCDAGATVFDVLGVVSGRLARLDLGICLLLAARGDSSQPAEAMPAHRDAGWWCVGQSALHSVAYVFFYLWTGGLLSLWQSCFPVPSPRDGTLNRLGLVNFMGLLAFVVTLALVVPAWPSLRRGWYHLLQRLHLTTAALFVLGCALHDLPMLLFAIPGLAEWYEEWRGRFGAAECSCSPRQLNASLRLLHGTSGPWVEVTIEQTANLTTESPRGLWLSLRVLELGKEAHPLSVASVGTNRLSVVVSARGGDWSKALSSLAPQQPTSRRIEVQVAGPYAVGGGEWSLIAHDACRVAPEPELLLLAGGTGVTGWLPALAAADSTGRPCHLVWCVQKKADYRALAACLPPTRHVIITIYVTQATTTDEIAAVMSDAEEASTASHTGKSECDSSVHGHTESMFAARTSTSVPILTTLVGVMVYLAWERLGLRALVVSDINLASYTLTGRLLPIVLIVAVMLIAMALSTRLVACTQARKLCCLPVEYPIHVGLPPHGTTGARLLEASLLPAASSCSLPAQGLPLADSTEASSAASEFATAGHDVRMGRPDLCALVCEAATRATAHRLVVAACGPPSLVAAARKAVASSRKSSECRGVRIQFSGADPRW